MTEVTDLAPEAERFPQIDMNQSRIIEIRARYQFSVYEGALHEAVFRACRAGNGLTAVDRYWIDGSESMRTETLVENPTEFYRYQLTVAYASERSGLPELPIPDSLIRIIVPSIALQYINELEHCWVEADFIGERESEDEDSAAESNPHSSSVKVSELQVIDVMASFDGYKYNGDEVDYYFRLARDDDGQTIVTLGKNFPESLELSDPIQSMMADLEQLWLSLADKVTGRKS